MLFLVRAFSRTLTLLRSTMVALTRIALSLCVLILERMSHNMISPILSEWDWTHSQLHELHNHNSSTGNSTSTSVSSTIYYTGVAIVVATPIVGIAFSPLSGFIGDHIGYETALITGLLFSSGMALCFAFSANFEGILIARILQGVASAFCTPYAFATITQECPQDTKIGKIVLAIAVTTSCFSYVGAAVFGAAFEYLGLKRAFFYCFTFYVCYATRTDVNQHDQNFM